MRHRLALIILPACVLASGMAAVPCAAATFYVDQASGACSDAGPGSEAQPYCTISAAVTAHSGPGVTIIVRPGVYPEQVTIPAPGSAGSPFVLRGEGGTVVVDGANDLSGVSNWQVHAGTVFVAPAVLRAPLQVFVDGARLAPSEAEPADLPPGTFRHVVPGGLCVNLGGDNPGTHEVRAGDRMHGFRISSRAYVTVEGFDVLRTEDRGIYLTGPSTGCTIRNNRVRFSNHYGIALSGAQGVTVAANTATDNHDDGISLVAGASGCVIENNECARNAHPIERRAQGIELSGATGNLLQRNRIHHNQDTGEHFSAGASNNISVQNRSWGNGDHGYDRLNSMNTVSIGDVAVGNVRDGFSNEGNSSGGQMFNCIAIDNGLETRRFDLWVDPQASIGFVSDFNIFWNSAGHPPVKYVATIYANVAQYVAASGQDQHTIEADPGFVDVAAADFHLLAGSPAIDAAASGVTSWPATDAEGYGRVDDPAVVNTGTGPVLYADRGALEFRDIPDAPPVVTAPAAVTATSGSPLAVVVTASDPDGEPIASLSAGGLPPGARFRAAPGNSHGTLWWVPPEPPGSHTVTFTAANALTGSAVTLITVESPNQPPVAGLSVKPATGTAPLDVTADATASSDADGTPASYTFDFGDGMVTGPQPEATAPHTYAAGIWIATVTVTDNRGGTGSTSRTVVVAPSEYPNLAGNPSFESDLTGWTMFLGSTLQRVSGGAHGDFALQMTGLETTTTFGVNDTPNSVVTTPAVGTRYQFSAQVRSESHTGTAKLRVREYLGGVLQTGGYSEGVVLTPQWQQLVLYHVTAAAGSTLDFQVMDFPVTTGEVMLVDDVIIRDVTWMGDVLDVNDVERTPLEVRVQPSPVHTDATMSFRTTAQGGLRVDVYDLRGRRVRQLLERADAPAGFHRIPFDGRDDAGLRLPSGVYFYRVRARQGEAGGRFLVVR